MSSKAKSPNAPSPQQSAAMAQFMDFARDLIQAERGLTPACKLKLQSQADTLGLDGGDWREVVEQIVNADTSVGESAEVRFRQLLLEEFANPAADPATNATLIGGDEFDRLTELGRTRCGLSTVAAQAVVANVAAEQKRTCIPGSTAEASVRDYLQSVGKQAKSAEILEKACQVGMRWGISQSRSQRVVEDYLALQRQKARKRGLTIAGLVMVVAIASAAGFTYPIWLPKVEAFAANYGKPAAEPETDPQPPTNVEENPDGENEATDPDGEAIGEDVPPAEPDLPDLPEPLVKALAAAEETGKFAIEHADLGDDLERRNLDYDGFADDLDYASFPPEGRQLLVEILVWEPDEETAAELIAKAMRRLPSQSNDWQTAFGPVVGLQSLLELLDAAHRDGLSLDRRATILEEVAKNVRGFSPETREFTLPANGTLEEHQTLVRDLYAFQVLKGVATRAVDAPNLTSEVYVNFSGPIKRRINRPDREPFEIQFVTTAIIALGDDWQRHEALLTDLCTSPNRGTLARMVTLLERVPQSDLRDHLQAALATRLNVNPTGEVYEVASEFRRALTNPDLVAANDGSQDNSTDPTADPPADPPSAQANPEAQQNLAGGRWKELAAAMETQTQNLEQSGEPTWLHRLSLAAHEATLSQALAAGDLGFGVFDELSPSSPTYPLISLPSEDKLPVRDEPTLANPRGSRDYRDVLASLQAAVGEEPPEADPPVYQRVRWFALNGEALGRLFPEELSAIIDYLMFPDKPEADWQRLGPIAAATAEQFPKIRIALADWIASHPEPSPQQKELLWQCSGAKADGGAVPGQTGGSPTVEQRSLPQIQFALLSSAADVLQTRLAPPKKKSFNLSAIELDWAERLLLGQYQYRLRAAGFRPTTYRSLPSPAAGLQALIDSNDRRAEVSDLSADVRRELKRLQRRAPAIELLAKNDVQKTVLLQRHLLAQTGILVQAEKGESVAADVAKIQSDLLRQDQAAELAANQLLLGEEALAKMWQLYGQPAR